MEKVSIAEGVNWATRASRQATAVHQGISCSEVSDVALSTDADSDYDEFPAGGSFYVFLDALAWSYVSSMEAACCKPKKATIARGLGAKLGAVRKKPCAS